MLTSPKVFQTVQSSRKKAEKEWNNITQWPDSDYSFLWKETVGNLQILGKFSTLTTLNTMTTIHCHRSPISEAEKFNIFFKVDSRQRLGLKRWPIQRKVKHGKSSTKSIGKTASPIVTTSEKETFSKGIDISGTFIQDQTVQPMEYWSTCQRRRRRNQSTAVRGKFEMSER